MMLKDVMDYGALGDGTGAFLNARYATLADAQVDYPFVTNIATQTIDWAAATACFNWQTSTGSKGTIFFPPGTYVFSEPLFLEPFSNMVFTITGSLAGSTIKGNFNEYVLKKTQVGLTRQCFLENLTVINEHATGGGIRFGGCVGAAMRNVTVTANIGINQQGDDTVDGGSTSLEFTMLNCQVNPGANTSGSIGMIIVCNGTIGNCRITGYEKGVITWGHQGGHNFQGCYFEGNQIGYYGGLRPNGTPEFDAGGALAGCHFVNNGTALYLPNDAGQMHLHGVRIDADEAVTVYGSPPQYGIQMQNIFADMMGVLVTGQYEQAAIVVDNGNTQSPYTGVAAFNTSTHPGAQVWDMSASRPTIVFRACNIQPITPAGNTIFIVPITSCSLVWGKL